MGLTIQKKTPAAVAPAPEPEVAAKKLGGITIGKKPNPAEVLATGNKPANISPALKAKLTEDKTVKGKVTESTEKEEAVVGAPTTAVATDNPEALCRVGVQAQYTHNLGNYNSTKVGVSLSVPCKHDEIGPVYDFCEDWVNTRMGKMVESLAGGE